MESQMVFKRYELKYLLDRRQLEAILKAIAPFYGHRPVWPQHHLQHLL